MEKFNRIEIRNVAPDAVCIEVEGTIGVPEEWQFENPGMRVATYEKFRGIVERIAAIEAPQVCVNIRSTGGDVNDAMLIYDALRALGGRVVTRCSGYVASAATVIAQAASPGCREISANALYLVHRAVCNCEGDALQMRHSGELLDKTDRRLAEIYAAGCSRLTADDYLALMSENEGRGVWLSPGEALEWGLVDAIAEASPAEPESGRSVSAATANAMATDSATDRMDRPDGADGPAAGRLAALWGAVSAAVSAVLMPERRAGRLRGAESRCGEEPEESGAAGGAAGPERGARAEEDARTGADGGAPGGGGAQEPPRADAEYLLRLREQERMRRFAEGMKRAERTRTREREDPASAEGPRTANQTAYEQDARQFRPL